jgi:DNA primase small subunit
VERAKQSSYKFLESLVREYYRKARLELPRDFVLREFAVQPWWSSSYVRHLAFNSEVEVRRYAVDKAPRHFYYSSARYDQPAAKDMDAKGWRSADIVFDIDADHLPACEQMVVKLELGDVKASFTPPECIREAALQVLLLHDILVNELGFDRKAVEVVFSGHRGFHVIVRTQDDLWGTSGADVRRELVNYVKALDYASEAIYPPPPRVRRRVTAIPPSEQDPGLRGRLARFKRILASLQRSTLDDESVLNYLHVYVDEQVTVDVKRLIRVPGSINGKTMLPVVRLRRVEDVIEFNLEPSLSPYSGHDPIRIVGLVDTPVVDVLGHKLKLRRGVRMKLEAPLALYLLAKGVAALAN